MDDRWWVKSQCRLERSAAECRQAISCDLRRNQRQLTTGNVVASTISCRTIEAMSTGVYVPGWTDYAVTVLRQFAELLYDESSKRTEVTKQCYAGLACGESVVRLTFWALTQVFIWLHLNKALSVGWSPRTARSSNWAKYIQIQLAPQ